MTKEEELVPMRHKSFPVRIVVLLPVVLGLLFAGCAPGNFVTAPSPTPLPSAKLSLTQLKYRLLDQFGDIFYCDPDFYPVGRPVDAAEFARRYSAIENKAEEFQAILEHNHLAAFTALSDGQKQLVYAEHKKLNTMRLEPAGDQYKFRLVIPNGKIQGFTGQGFTIEGLIDQTGTITVSKKEAIITTCPICLAGDTHIDTPGGLAFVRNLQKGMSVWTLDAAGQRQPAVIEETIQRAVAPGASLIHLVLADGRELRVSPGHSLEDGRVIGSLSVGDVIDGARMIRVDPIRNADATTFDILPAGATGTYWANGILLKSTLSIK